MSSRQQAGVQAILLAAMALALSVAVARQAVADEPAPQRIVCLGDSITSGHTYPLLVQQALVEAGKPVPIFLNAGLGGDTAKGMRGRLERDVLPRRPTLVMLSAGINDLGHGVTVADYEADVRGIAEALKAKGVPMLLLTTSVIDPPDSPANAQLDHFNEAVHRVANDYGYPVAEVNAVMRTARASGEDLLEVDHCHVNFAGYRQMARAVLDALGYTDVPVPSHFKLEPLSGVIGHWQVRALAESHSLDAASVAALVPDSSWKPLDLPDAKTHKHWWWDQVRRQGFAVSLNETAGQGQSYQAVTALESKEPREVFFSPGASLRTIWLNGQRIYQASDPLWHPDRDHVKAMLKAGSNTLIIETGNEFFLSLNDHDAS